MKKLLCLLLAALMAASLMACAGGESAPTTTAPAEKAALQVGYGRAAFTPSNPVKITNQEQSTFSAVYEDVYVTCVALTDP